MKINEIQVTPIKPKNGLVGFASLVLNDSIYIGFIGIHTKLQNNGEYRLTYPTKIVSGKDLNIYHPIKKELSQAIEVAVITKFKNVMNSVNDRYYHLKYTEK